MGHTAFQCWHCTNLHYTFSPIQKKLAMHTTIASSTINWLLNFSVSHHLSNDTKHLLNASPYTGSDHIKVGNGHSVLINHINHDIPPTLVHKLTLSPNYTSHNSSQKLLFVYKLATYNNCPFFYENGLIIKDKKTNQLFFTYPILKAYILSTHPANHNPSTPLQPVSLQPTTSFKYDINRWVTPQT